MKVKARNAAKIAISVLMALVLVLGLFTPVMSVAHADETGSNNISTTANEQKDAQKNEQEEDKPAADYLSASYLVPVGCVLTVLIGFYIFLSVKTKKRSKKPTGKKPVKKP